jgi:ABC-type branched-subunit amino acid transport system substrate-binding protein
VLYQNDDFGKDLLGGFKKAIEGTQLTIVAEQSYEVTDPSIDPQMRNLAGSKADVFLDITTPKFGSQALAADVRNTGWNPLHIINNVAASVGSVLTPAGLDKSVGLVTVEYYQDPTDPQWDNEPAMKEWRAFMAKYYPDGNTKDASNLYGDLAAQTMVQVLKQCGDDLTRENVMKQAASLKDFKLPLMLPGMAINTSPTDFFPFEQAKLAKFSGKQWELFGEVIG